MAAVVGCSPAYAEDAVDRAAAAFENGPGIYVDPHAQDIDSSDATTLGTDIRGGDAPIYLAVLPDATSAETNAELRRLVSLVRHRGTYAVLAGNHLRVASDTGVPAGALALQAIRDHPDDKFAALQEFVDDVQASGSTGRGGVPPVSEPSTPKHRTGFVPLAFLGVVVALGAAAIGVSTRRRRQRDAAALAQVMQAAEEDVTAFGEDVAALDLDSSSRALDNDLTRADYTGALDAYDRAKQALAAARRPADLAAVSSALEEGRWRMECVRARLAGRPVPQRLPPCFFNPRHGPSSTDVSWAPPGGTPRTVPVCAADTERLARGDEPDVRRVVVAGRPTPYWQAGRTYGPWAGGWYGSWGGLGAGLLGGLLIGDLISPGPALGYDAGHAAGYDTGQDADGDWDVGGGDFGSGGDWDVGDGDIGGGDFGDFGGGDF